MSMQTIAILLESSGKFSDVSSSHYSSSSLSSWADSCNDAVPTSLRRNVTFPVNCLSQGFKAKAQQQRTLSRWDSWAERTPRESPKMPSRRDAVNHLLEPAEKATAPTTRNKKGAPAKRGLNKETSRWSSHHQSSSRVPSLTPRRSFSPLRKGSALPQETSNLCDSRSVTAFPVNNVPSNKQESHKVHNRLLLEKSPNRKPIKMSISPRRYQYSVA
jgi:hypothetical protein